MKSEGLAPFAVPSPTGDPQPGSLTTASFSTFGFFIQDDPSSGVTMEAGLRAFANRAALGEMRIGRRRRAAQIFLGQRLPTIS